MPAFRLPDHIHFCEIGGERLFLDLEGDRYFQLPPAADAAFSALQQGDTEIDGFSADIAFLRRAGVLLAAPDGRPLARTCHVRPNRSLVEGQGPPAGLRPGTLIEAWLLVRRARRAVASKSLPAHLRALASSRPAARGASIRARDRLVREFGAARRYVPIAPNCLYDSIALCRFLQRRGIAADLVIGAKLHPFGAHCWLQDGTVVLNDTLAAARDFEPVLVA